MSNSTQLYVIEFQNGKFYAKYEDEHETTNKFLAADTFTLKEAIKKAKSLGCEYKFREFIPASLGQEINPKQDILDVLYLCSTDETILNDQLLKDRINQIIKMVKEYM